MSKDFWTVLQVESSQSGDPYPHYQERVEVREVPGGVIVHTMNTVWTSDDYRVMSEALLFVPNITLAEMAGDAA